MAQAVTAAAASNADPRVLTSMLEQFVVVVQQGKEEQEAAEVAAAQAAEDTLRREEVDRGRLCARWLRESVPPTRRSTAPSCARPRHSANNRIDKFSCFSKFICGMNETSHSLHTNTLSAESLVTTFAVKCVRP